MRTKKQKAAVSAGTEATTQTTNRQYKTYQNSITKSRVKQREPLSEEIWKLLIYLVNPLLTDKEKQRVWQLFASSLRKLIAVKGSRGAV